MPGGPGLGARGCGPLWAQAAGARRGAGDTGHEASERSERRGVPGSLRLFVRWLGVPCSEAAYVNLGLGGT